MKRRTVLVGRKKDVDAWLAEAPVHPRDCVVVTSALSVLQLRGRDPRDLDVVVLPSATRLKGWADIQAELEYMADLVDRARSAKGATP